MCDWLFQCGNDGDGAWPSASQLNIVTCPSANICISKYCNSRKIQLILIVLTTKLVNATNFGIQYMYRKFSHVDLKYLLYKANLVKAFYFEAVLETMAMPEPIYTQNTV